MMKKDTDLYLVRSTSSTDPLFESATDLYRQSFPYHEQRESGSKMTIMYHPDYHFNLILENGSFVGLLLCWETRRSKYVEQYR